MKLLDLETIENVSDSEAIKVNGGSSFYYLDEKPPEGDKDKGGGKGSGNTDGGIKGWVREAVITIGAIALEPVLEKGGEILGRIETGFSDGKPTVGIGDIVAP
ncbi:hypothetical protein F7734_58560 [Scytonema sp. UIC 10036]|uniref:hypothetical protein n=1 Tax=Scytonema sp. UIC 10036 TaxID=2304196 RepID=UPI0012DA8633|nr:hypothetical protein [Scytonema sp. UIC 10036]MUH01551.1 hypothetical protein [Scytonema sp. UIC 10036]